MTSLAAGAPRAGDPLDLLTATLDRARAAGADAADAVLVDRRSLSLGVRLGVRESLERSEAGIVGLRVLVGKRQAVVSSSDVSPKALGELVDRALAMARVVPEDPYCGLADPSELVTEVVDIDGYEAGEVAPTQLEARAIAAEDAARAVTGVTNSEGAEAGWGVELYAIAATNGLAQSFRRSWHSLSVSVLAGEGTAMERDYEYSGSAFLADLDDAAALGQRCGARAVRRLNPRKVASAQVPVIYEERVARSLLSHFAAAINGASVVRGTTFLHDKLGETLFAPSITIVDDPFRKRGLRSRPFDGEGIAPVRRDLVAEGRLTSWLLDLRSGRQLGMASTGHASRGASSLPSPSPSNLYIAAGEISAEALIGSVASGFYVTDLMGFGINGVTGDYSRGASGFWIENGALAYPVSEMTVSGNLLSMFREMTAASDLNFRHGIDAPTLRLDGMTVAGQ